MEEMSSEASHVVDMKRCEVSAFKTTNAKRVPLEKLDFSIYKPSTNQVAFSSTEERLPIWINAMLQRYQNGGVLKRNNITTSVEEVNDILDENKCEKVTINLKLQLKNNHEENLLTITIFVTKGRVLIQGRIMKEWSNTEFPILLELVNDHELLKSQPDKNLSNLINPLLQQKKDLLEPETSCNATTEKSLSTFKENLSKLEAEFVTYKQNTNKEINGIHSLLATKEKEITCLKDEIHCSKKEIADLKDQNCDLVLKQSILENELKSLTNRLKSLQSKQTDTTIKLAGLAEINQTPEKKVTAEPATTFTPNITTSNRFTPLNNETNPDAEKTITLNNNPGQMNDKEEEKWADSQPEQSMTETVDDRKNIQEQPRRPHQRINHADNIILCDSNGRHLNTSLLCPSGKSSYIRSPTLTLAKQIIQNTKFTSAKCMIIHTGTNDLEHSENNEDMLKTSEEIIELISNELPNCHIILSTLLPRNDNLDQRVTTFNESITKRFSSKKNVTIVTHRNIKKEFLKDKKHLDSHGVRCFAQSLKRAFFKCTPSLKKYNHTYTNNYSSRSNWLPPTSHPLSFSSPPPFSHRFPAHPSPSFPLQNKPTTFQQSNLAPELVPQQNLYRKTHTSQELKQKEEIPNMIRQLIKDLSRYV